MSIDNFFCSRILEYFTPVCAANHHVLTLNNGDPIRALVSSANMHINELRSQNGKKYAPHEALSPDPCGRAYM